MKKFHELTLVPAVAALAGLLVVSPASAWDAPVLVSSNADDTVIDLFSDGKGRTVAVWTYLEGGDRRLAASIKPAGGQFGLPFNVTEDAIGYTWSGVATKKGTVSVAWEADDGPDRRIRIADLLPKATAFTAATSVSPAGENNETALIGADKKGNTIVAWHNENNVGLEVAVRPAGGTFGTVQEIASDRDVTQPSLHVSAAGHALLAWRSDVFPDPNQILASVRLPGAAFSPYQVVSNPAEVSLNPSAAMDAKGNAILAFDTNRHALLSAGSTTFGAPVTEDLEYFPRFLYDKKGNLHAMSRDYLSLYMETPVRTMPVGSTTFGPPSVLAQSGFEVYGEDMAVDKKGNLRIVGVQVGGSGGPRIFTAYRPVGGTFSLMEYLTPESDSCGSPHVVFDKKGNATVTYVKWNPGTSKYELWATSTPRI